MLDKESKRYAKKDKIEHYINIVISICYKQYLR